MIEVHEDNAIIDNLSLNSSDRGKCFRRSAVQSVESNPSAKIFGVSEIIK